MSIVQRALAHRWALLAAGLTLTVACYGLILLMQAVQAPPLVTFVDDAACDLEWARLQATGKIMLNGHWSNTLGTTHPGPWYLWLLAAGGWLGEAAGAGFDLGASFALAATGVLLAGAAAWAVGRTYTSARLAFALVAAAFAVSASTQWRGVDTGVSPAFGMQAWAGALIPWAVTAVLCALWCLPGQWRWRAPYAIAVSGFTASLYLPAALLAVPALIAGWVVAVRAGKTVQIGAAVASLTWLPMVARAATEGLGAYLPQRVHVDVYGNGVLLEEGLAALANSLWGAPQAVAVAGWGALLVSSLGWVIMAVRQQRPLYRPVLLCSLVLLALGQHLLVWPTPLNRYQTNWAAVSVAFLIAAMAWRLMPRRAVLAGSAAVFVASLLTGALPTEPARVVLADPAVTERLTRAFSDAGITPGQRAGIVVDAQAWNAGQAVVHHARSAGIDVCTIGRRDFAPLECTTRPDLVLLVSAEPDGSEFSGTPVNYGSQFWIRLLPPGEKLPATELPAAHLQQPRS